MSDNLSVEDIRRKIGDGVYETFQRDATKTDLWKCFFGIRKADGSAAGGSAESQIANVTDIPYVQCRKCAKMLSYEKIKGGTSHLRRHASACQSAKPSPSSTTQISNFFKSSSVPLALKQDVTLKCAEFACRDLRPFETVAGDGFVALAQALISVGVKYGQVSAKDVLPHPTTVSRRIADVTAKVRQETVMPEILNCLNKWGGGITTDMWTESYRQVSYITVTVHYITDEWKLVERIIATRQFDPELRHTAVNIKQVVNAILAEFSVDPSKAVFVTDRGANVLAAMKDWKHISCSDHMLNTVLTTLFDNLDECPHIKALLAGSKELVRYFKKSGLMRHLSTTLKQEVSTRWNTMFYLLESVLTNFVEIHHILTTRGEGYRMAAVDKELLEVIVPFLEVFKAASLELEATAKPTLHLPLPWFYKLQQHCKPDNSNDDEMQTLQHKASALLNNKFCLQPLHHVATALNPRMKSMKMLPDCERDTVYDALRSMITNITTTSDGKNCCYNLSFSL